MIKIKFWKKYSDQVIGAGILTLLYLGEAVIRPCSGPDEYQFAARFGAQFPEYSQLDIMLRLPSILLTLASGVLFYFLVKKLDFKRPGMAAAFYLLFPPIFYLGSSASLVPALNFGVLASACAIHSAITAKSLRTRFLAAAAIIAGLAVIALYSTSRYFHFKDFGILAATAVVCGLSFWANRRERSDKENFLRTIDRIAFFCAVIAGVLAILLWVPVLLRHFKVDFPEGVAFYGRHERLIRPMLVLIISVIWLGLARESKKAGKKLFLCNGALAFFLFFLPVTIPWQLQKDIYWHHSLTPVLRQIDSQNCVCLCGESEVTFFRKFFNKTLVVSETVPGAIKPENLKTEVEKLLKTSNVMVVCYSRQLEKQSPVFAGKRFRTGKFNLIYYYKHGVDKK